MTRRTSEAATDRTRHRCAGCDNTWTALGRAHCSACHRTFSGLSSFDQHRHHGECRDPAGMSGLLLDEAGYWRSAESRPPGSWSSSAPQGAETPSVGSQAPQGRQQADVAPLEEVSA
jgi:hypothetical protein